MVRRKDGLVSLMRYFNILVTREYYLHLAYMGEVPDPLGAGRSGAARGNPFDLAPVGPPHNAPSLGNLLAD
jgi:hypothetical protein